MGGESPGGGTGEECTAKAPLDKLADPDDEGSRDCG